MKRMEKWFRHHKGIATALILSFFLLLTCSSFPIYNLTRNYPAVLDAMTLFVNLSIYSYLGGFLSRIYRKATFYRIALIQLALILGGMLCRFLLEYGEVSNTYNFTPANVALHLVATLTISSLSWWWTRSHVL